MQKNLFLWGHPRSLSTAMELYFRSRGDYDVIHEPFANSYWKGESANSARQSLLDSLARSSQPVFVKDIAHHVRFDGLREAGFLNRFEHIILVRSPLATFRSHLAVNPEVKPHEFGYQALYDLYMRLGQRLHCAPIVISSDALLKAPEEAIKRMCRQLQIAHIPEALSWKPQQQSDWQAGEKWQITAGKSSGIEVRREETLPPVPDHLVAIYEHHQSYYELLSAQFSMEEN